MSRRTIGILLVLECVAGAALVGWRMNRPAAPRLNFERMPAPSAKDLDALRRSADRGGAEAWSAYGAACLANGYLIEAQSALDRALTQNRDQLDTRWFLARTREKLGDIDGAISEYQEILSVPATGREAICWYRIGRNHLRAERLTEADAAFQRAGVYPAAVLERARLRLRAGELPEAERLIRDLQKQPVPDVYVEMLAVELARLHQNRLELAVALERLERSSGVLESQREWKDVEAVRNGVGLERRQIEISQLRARQPALALQAFRDMLAEIPRGYTDHYSTLALQLVLQARDARAADELKTYYERRIALPPLTQHYVAAVYWESQDEKRVGEASRRANALLPMSDTSEHLARIANARGDAQEERKMMALSVLVEGTAQYRMGEPKKALEKLQQTLTINPQSAEAWFIVGEIQLSRGDLELAGEGYRQCLQADPRFGRAKERLAALP